MPIHMVWRFNRYCPIVFCDDCGREILDRRGLVVWQRQDADPPALGAPVFFTHADFCNRRFETARPGGSWMWLSLEVFPIHVAANLGIDLDDARDTARALDF